MKRDGRQRRRKLLELVRFLMGVLPATHEHRRCCFCRKDLLPQLLGEAKGWLRYTLHHWNEDRTPACGARPLCGHVKRPAHEACHKRHHIRATSRRLTAERKAA